MDIGSTFAQGLCQQCVNHAYNRCIIGGLQQIFNRRHFLHQPREIQIRLDFIDHLRSIAAGSRVSTRNRCFELFA